MFKKVLIANRGEIALRVIRACKVLGIPTVAIYSEADAGTMHVQAADETVCVGPAAAARSYLNIPNVLSAAESVGADAIHPGYGFLAESSHFAEVCELVGIKMIGPAAATIGLMGNKVSARALMVKHGVPVVPGGAMHATLEETAALANRMGYPVMIKAAAGGGGRGIRRVMGAQALPQALQTAQNEAKAAFGDDRVYIEKYFSHPRHIEVQVLADARGQVVHLGERDCSIQRRHQKLIEESPSPVVDASLRKRLTQMALRAARACHYTNAGTVEFLVDGHEVYFLEMNTRIQVEHPVSEMISGIDLVVAQIQIAAGMDLPWTQRQIVLRGHSLECRINAESPDTWEPSPGTITTFRPPGGPGVRIDTAYGPGSIVSPYYDSLIAKLLVHAPTRAEAIARMRAALSEFTIEGIQTSLPFHLRMMSHDAFIKGDYSTQMLDG